MGLTINELVTKFKFEVDQAGLNKYDDAIKKSRNTEKKSTREKLDDIDKLFKQFNDNKSKEAKIEAKLKKEKEKWLNEHNKLELKYIKEKESIRNKINALNVKDANTRVKESKAQIEAELKGYKLKQDAVKWLADLKAKKASQELQDQRKIRDEQEKLNAANRKNLAEYNSRNRMAKLDALLEERRQQRRNHQERLDQLRQERRDRLASLAETGAMMYGAKTTVNILIADPLKVAGDMQEANIFLKTFGDTNAQGLKFIQKKIKEGAKIGGVMPLDIEQMVIELGKAGYKGKGSGDKNELAKMIPYIMKLSRATGGSATEAGELLTNTAASFNITSDKGYSQLTDMFVYALNESKLNFSDLSSALKLSGGASAGVAESIPTILANMAIGRNKGITASTLGSSGRQISLRPVSIADSIGADIKKRGKTKPIAKAYKELGITEGDILTKGGGLDKDKLFGYLRKKFKMNDTDLEAISLGTYNGPQKKSQLAIGNIMKDLFGMTSVSMAMALLRETKRDKEIREGFTNKKYIGAADDVINKLNTKENFNFQARQAEIEFYYARQNFGKEFLPLATKITKALTDILEKFANLDSKSLEWYKSFASLAVSLVSVGAAITGISLALKILVNTHPLVLVLSLVLADLINYFTGAPTLVEGLIMAFRKFQESAVVGLIKGLEKVINYFRELFGYSQLDFNINNRNLPETPKELLPPSMRKDAPKPSVRVPFLSNAPNISKYIAKPVTMVQGGTTHKSSRSDTVVNITQTINANNSGTPERIGQIVQDVTKKNLIIINSMKAQRVTAF